ncbi:MAG TPA: Fic family protein [Virgibacillus sp.]|nr:Fic family protein [Virgibacillus sp.]HLR68354.1 Fic family protein [Virgibacillus sp.]
MKELVKKMTPEYLNDVLVRLAHHSSAIEGNTITLPETATIILDQTLPNNSKITRREYFEVLNHEQTFEYVIDQIRNETPLSVSVIKDIHEKLTDRLQYDKGKFKENENYIEGAEFSTALPQKVPELINQLVGNLEYKIDIARSDEDVVKAILESHITFEKIHPFSDGNGRTGRMVMNYSLLENGLPPLIINKENKGLYNQILHEAQMKSFPSENDIEVFYEFTAPFLLKEEQRIESFNYKEQNQMIDLNGVKKANINRNGRGNGLER